MHLPVYGNQHLTHILPGLLDSLQHSTNHHIGSIIFYGPPHIGKTTIIEHIASLLLGDNTLSSGYIPIYETQSDKKTIIKIQGEKQTILGTSHHKTIYERGIRDIIERCHMSSLNSIKIVGIEGIERMNRSAANAFLKTLEEPPVNTLILATSNNIQSVLPTIQSRSIMIPMHRLNDTEMDELLSAHDIAANHHISYKQYAVGQPGLFLSHHNGTHPHQHKKSSSKKTIIYDINEVIPLYDRLRTAILHHDITTLHTILSQLIEHDSIDTVLSRIEHYCWENKMHDRIEILTTTHQMIQAHVSMDNLLFRLALTLGSPDSKLA